LGCGEKGHRFDAIAIAITDEGGVVALAPQPRRAVARAAGGQGGAVECLDGVTSRRAQRDMGAAIVFRRGDARPMIEPELGIFLAEADGRCSHHELGIAERRQNALIKSRAGGKVAHRNGDVVDHGCSSCRARAPRPLTPERQP